MGKPAKPLLTRRALDLVAENKIRQAMAEGAFDHLPGLGEPIPDLEEPYDPQWWIKKWIRRERLERLTQELRRAREG
jgi:hypothetical protein